MTYFIFNPEAAGIELFGTEHIIMLALAAIITPLLTITYCRLDKKARRRMGLAVASLTLISELARLTGITASGNLGWDQLPLHLCGLAVFVGFFHALFPTAITGELLYSLCMPGALFALLFPGWLGQPSTSFFSANSFFSHILLFSYPIMLVAGKDIKPKAKRLPLCFLLLAAVSLPLYFLNLKTGANYFFLLFPSPGSPLELFASWWGEPWYIAGYIPMIAVIWLILYLPFRKKQRHRP